MEEYILQYPIPSTVQCTNIRLALLRPIEVGNFCINDDNLYGEDSYNLCRLHEDFSQPGKGYNIDLKNQSSVDVCEPYSKPDVRYSLEPLLRWIFTHQADISKSKEFRRRGQK